MHVVTAAIALAFLTAAGPDDLGWTPKRAADREVLHRANAALLLKSPQKAIDALVPLLKRDPACDPCKRTLAKAWLMANRADEAYLQLKELQVAHPAVHRLEVEVAWAAFAAQRFSAAQRASLSALGRHPDDSDALHLLVQTVVRTGELGLGEKTVRRVQKHHDDALIACLQVSLLAERKKIPAAERALAVCRTHADDHLVGAAEYRLASVSGDEARFLTAKSRRLAERSPTRKVTDAVKLHDLGRTKEAKRLLVPYVRRFKNDLYARGVLGVLRLELGEKAKAKVDLEACLKGRTWIDTDYDGSLSGILTRSAETQMFVNLQRFATTLVQLYIDDGRLDDAKRILASAERLYEQTPELFDARARLAFASGDLGAGWHHVERGLQAFPDHPLLLQLATAFVHRAEGAPPRVTASLERTQSWTVLYNLAVEAQHADRYPACLQAAEDALAIAPLDRKAKTRAVLLHCAVETRDLNVATPLLRDVDVVALKPDVVLRHAWFLSQEGNPHGALSAVLSLPADGSKAARQKRDAAAATYHAELGQLDEAVALLNAKDADPETLLYVGTTLENQGRTEEGQAMVARACRRPTTAELRADCNKR